MRQIATLLVLLTATTVFGADPDSPKPLSAEEAFLNPEVFVVTADVTETKWEKLEKSSPKQEAKDHTYLISLQNRSKVKLVGLRIDYCTYRKWGNSERSKLYSKKIGSISPFARETFSKTISSLRFIKSGNEDALLGLRARIYLPLSDGREVMREICIPKSLSAETYPWQNPQKNEVLSVPPTKTYPVIRAVDYSKYKTTKLRMFTKNDGSKISGYIKSFSPNDDIVKIEGDDKTQVELQPSDFSKPDQEYIQNWYMASILHGRNKLRVTLTKNRRKDVEYDEEMLPKLNQGKSWWTFRDTRTCDAVDYDICLDNRSGYVLNDIRIAYRIYHQAEVEEEILKGRMDAYKEGDFGEGPSGGWVTLSRRDLSDRIALDTISGQFAVGELSPKDQITKQTDRMLLPENINQRYDPKLGRIGPGTRNVRTIDCDLLGIRYRVYLPLASGGYMMKEFAEPERLLKETKWPAE